MFFEAWILLGFLAGLALLVVAAHFYQKRKDEQAGPDAYNWQPEQDYDVIHEGGANMTPAFPKMVKREKPGVKSTNRKQ